MKKALTFLGLVLCMSLILTGCAQTKDPVQKPATDQDQKPSTEQGQKLTQEQIDAVNAAFTDLLPADTKLRVSVPKAEGDMVLNPITHFFRSYYETPEQMDMGSFVYYMPRESYLTAADETEIASLREAGMKLPFNSIEDSPVPFGRIPYDTVDQYLQRYMGVSLKDMKNQGNALYSDAYKSYYSYASDFGPGMFLCTGGEIKGDTVTLTSDKAILTLKKAGDAYMIVSHVEKK